MTEKAQTGDSKIMSHQPKTFIKEMAKVNCSPKQSKSASTREESLSNHDSIFESNPFDKIKLTEKVGNASKFGETYLR